MSFGLYDGYMSVAHLLIDPVVSFSGVHETKTTARANKVAKHRMKTFPANGFMLP